MINSRIPIIVNLPCDMDSVEILLAADIHTGSAEFDEKKYGRFEELLKRPNTFVIFAGDQMDNNVKTNKNSDVYTQKISPHEQKMWWVDHLRKYKEKILCIIDGNHEARANVVDNYPLYDIALSLGIEDRYRSEGAFVDIGVGNGGHGKGKQVRYVFRVSHIAKNNATSGTVDGFEGIDVFVSAHTHKPMDRPVGRLVYDSKNKHVSHKDIEVVVCGHFLTYGGYGERAGYRPASTKLYSVVLCGKKKKIETRGFHV